MPKQVKIRIMCAKQNRRVTQRYVTLEAANSFRWLTHPFGSPPYLELHEPWRGRLYKMAGVYNLAEIYSTSPPFHVERRLSATTGRGDRGVGQRRRLRFRWVETNISAFSCSVFVSKS